VIYRKYKCPMGNTKHTIRAEHGLGHGEESQPKHNGFYIYCLLMFEDLRRFKISHKQQASCIRRVVSIASIFAPLLNQVDRSTLV
jgi:hypothetical protein